MVCLGFQQAGTKKALSATHHGGLMVIVSRSCCGFFEPSFAPASLQSGSKSESVTGEIVFPWGRGYSRFAPPALV